MADGAHLCKGPRKARQCNCLEVAHERIGAMRTALIAAQTVIDASVHPRTATLIEIALNYKSEDEDV